MAPAQFLPGWTWRHPLHCISVFELDAFTPPGVPWGDATVSIPTLDFQVWAGSHKVDVIHKLMRNKGRGKEKQNIYSKEKQNIYSAASKENKR